MAKKLEIKIGSIYGRLTVVSEVEKLKIPSGQKVRRFKCACECGNQKTVLLLHLVRGRVSSCGCKKAVKLGESQTPLCKVWRAIHLRCKENYFESHLYYKKGIKVCDEWVDWFKFKEWSLKNGYKKGLQIDRKNNSMGYSPSNCRWVTSKVNNNNRDNTLMIVYDGKYQPIKPLLSLFYTILLIPAKPLIQAIKNFNKVEERLN